MRLNSCSQSYVSFLMRNHTYSQPSKHGQTLRYSLKNCYFCKNHVTTMLGTPGSHQHLQTALLVLVIRACWLNWVPIKKSSVLQSNCLSVCLNVPQHVSTASEKLYSMVRLRIGDTGCLLVPHYILIIDWYIEKLPYAIRQHGKI